MQLFIQFLLKERKNWQKTTYFLNYSNNKSNTGDNVYYFGLCTLFWYANITKVTVVVNSSSGALSHNPKPNSNPHFCNTFF